MRAGLMGVLAESYDKIIESSNGFARLRQGRGMQNQAVKTAGKRRC
jgi:hypothetical protein